MIRRLMPAALIAVLAGGATPAMARADIIGLLRSDIAAQKKVLLTYAMSMTEEESDVFWPIYSEYQNEARKIAEAQLALIKDYTANYDSMTDRLASDLSKRALKSQEARLKLYKKYNSRLAKALSPKLAARWLQAEHALNTMIDVQIASELPLMK